MAQKPVLWDRDGARAFRVWSVTREEAWASADVQGTWVSGFSTNIYLFYYEMSFSLQHFLKWKGLDDGKTVLFAVFVVTSKVVSLRCRNNFQ